jgi:prepilin-type N-terminal cleavage/methylation domain-containing protein
MDKRFTLIELLIVIAIIGVLMTILMPSLRNAKELSKLAVCMGSMSNVTRGMELLSKDDNMIIAHNYDANRFESMDWPKGVDPYLGGTSQLTDNPFHFRNKGGAEVFYGCPSTYLLEPGNTNKTIFSIDYGIAAGGLRRSYLGYKRTHINDPASSVLLVDTVNDTQGRVSFRTDDIRYNKRSGFTDLNYKHLNKTIPLSFFDGHIKNIKWIPVGAFRDKYVYELYNLPSIGLGNGTITYSW